MVEDGPEIVAHRGASADCPENTIVAFQEAWRQGADAIEGDFRLTSDGQIVCLHDKTLKRTTGDTRSINEVTLAQVRKLDAGSWKGSGFKGEQVPTIEEVFKIIPPSKRVFVELKAGPEIVMPLLGAIDRSDLEPEQIVVIAFDADVIRTLKNKRPGIRAYWLSSLKRKGSGFEPSADALITTARAVQADGLGLKAVGEAVTRDFVAKAHQAGLEVNVWTVDEPNAAQQFQAAGVSSITTNRPAFLRSSIGPEAP